MEQILAARIDMVTVSVVSIMFLMVMLFWSAARRGLSCLDLITDKGSGKMSLTKVANLFGMIVGGWVVMRMAIDKSLTETLFGVYLAYCAATHGFSNWLSARFRPGEGPGKTSSPAVDLEAPPRTP